jgi:hypothetical protein
VIQLCRAWFVYAGAKRNPGVGEEISLTSIWTNLACRIVEKNLPMLADFFFALLT